MVIMKFLKLELKNRTFVTKTKCKIYLLKSNCLLKEAFFVQHISYFLYFCNIWLVDSQKKKKLRILISFNLSYLDSYIVSGCQGETQFFQNGKNTFQFGRL